MSISGLVGLSLSHTNAIQNYDHTIILVNRTKVRTEPEIPVDDAVGSASLSRTGSGTPLNQKWTKGTLREELARRKYSKWQNESVKGQGDKPKESGNASESSDGEHAKGKAKQIPKCTSRNPFRPRKHSVKPLKNDTFIEVLYENQRGDSSAEFLSKDSPVNITDAQVPDPSWAWAWRTCFSHGYAWHGTHPWFHSFVRRRRWLRKPIRINSLKSSRNLGNMKDAHLLNADYFTIHASRERDRGRSSSADRTATRRTSMIESFLSEREGEDDIGDKTTTGPVRGRDLKDEDDNVGVSNPERDESRSSKEEVGKEGIVEEENRVSEAITEEIKGVPDEAEISEDQGIQWGSGQEDQRSTTSTAQEKGKGKESH